MIAVTKDEAKIVRDRFPHVHIRRTVNKYYMEENFKAMQFLKRTSDSGKEKRNA